MSEDDKVSQESLLDSVHDWELMYKRAMDNMNLVQVGELIRLSQDINADIKTYFRTRR